MQFSQDNRGTSDNGQPPYSRNYPGTKRFPTSQPPYIMNTADNGIQVQGVSHACFNSMAAMPYFSHEECSQGQPHETCTRSHGKHPQYHPCVGSCCPYLPHLNSSFAPFYTNQGSMDRVSHLSHKPTSNSFGFQNPSSSYAIRQETAASQYNISSTFVPSQSTMVSQQMNSMGVDMRDAQSQVSTTPRLSHVTTPDSIFSVAQPTGARNGSREVDTPASNVSVGHRTSIKKGTMSPANISSSHDRDTQEIEQSPLKDDWLSEYNGEDEGWMGNNDLLNTQSQATGAYMQQQNLDQHPQSQGLPSDTTFPTNTHNGLFNVDQPSTNTMNDWDQNFDFGGFPQPPSFADLDGELPGTEHDFSTTVYQNTYNYQQPGVNPQATGFDFNTPLNSHDAYGTNYQSAPSTLSSNNFGPDYPSSSGTGGPGRQGNHDRQKDELLIRLRQQGMSYKDIMATGKFDLQESTLRGRYRTLTKFKDQRVRKPVWDNNAIEALKDGVDALAPPSAGRSRTKDSLERIPWKKVAEWMRDNRGCYHYGNATVKKKYKEVISERQMLYLHGGTH